MSHPVIALQREGPGWASLLADLLHGRPVVLPDGAPGTGGYLSRNALMRSA